MITYNTTFVMSPSEEATFLSYLRQDYIPAVMQQGVLTRPSLRRILPHSLEDGEQVSIALAFDAVSEEILVSYLSAEGAILAQKLIAHFGDRVVGFTTLMQYIDLSPDAN